MNVGAPGTSARLPLSPPPPPTPFWGPKCFWGVNVWGCTCPPPPPWGTVAMTWMVVWELWDGRSGRQVDAEGPEANTGLMQAAWGGPTRCDELGGCAVYDEAGPGGEAAVGAQDRVRVCNDTAIPQCARGGVLYFCFLLPQSVPWGFVQRRHNSVFFSLSFAQLPASKAPPALTPWWVREARSVDAMTRPPQKKSSLRNIHV